QHQVAERPGDVAAVDVDRDVPVGSIAGLDAELNGTDRVELTCGEPASEAVLRGVGGNVRALDRAGHDCGGVVALRGERSAGAGGAAAGRYRVEVSAGAAQPRAGGTVVVRADQIRGGLAGALWSRRPRVAGRLAEGGAHDSCQSKRGDRRHEQISTVPFHDFESSSKV